MSAVIGIIIVVLGILFLGDNLGWFDYDLGALISDWWPAILILVGGWMIFQQRHEKDGSEWEQKVSKVMSKAIGDRHLKPTEIPAAGLVLKQGAGDLVVDLTETKLNSGENRIRCSLGAGDVKVTLPTGVAVKASASCGAGDIRLFELKEDGISNKLEHTDEGYDAAPIRISLKIGLGLGDVRVSRG